MVSFSPEALPKESSVVNKFRPSFLSAPSNKIRGILWKKKKPKVRDLIAYAQLDSVENEVHHGMNMQWVDDIFVDGAFRETPSHFLSRHIDQTTIDAFLKSITKESKLEQGPS
jgi:hypothetical protein